jgi:5-formyltetrahydrofolate cyclo-ligase
MMENWEEIRKWRSSTRAEMLVARMAVPRSEKPRIRSVLCDLIWEQFPELRHGCIGFYWPFKGEIDLRHLVRDLLAVGAEAALPVVVEKRQPLEFWSWRPRMKLARGIWNIPVPIEPNAVRPTALLVPLLGFDAAGYRLGYGGGYYDRTLATMNPKPLTIGVGYELGRLKTIYPQPHDIPLDAIVTEAGSARFRYRGESLGRRTPDPRMDEKLDEALKGTFPASDPFDLSDEPGSIYASPPCFMRELEPEYLGYLSTSETIALLNWLLEVERAGDPAVAEMGKEGAGVPDPATFRATAKDEAGFCAMLTRHITRLGGTPGLQTGAIYGKPMALDSSCERVELLNRGQTLVVRNLQEALPRIGDGALHRDLKNMLDVHERDIQRCKEAERST